jgi:hypothetical protein
MFRPSSGLKVGPEDGGVVFLWSVCVQPQDTGCSSPEDQSLNSHRASDDLQFQNAVRTLYTVALHSLCSWKSAVRNLGMKSFAIYFSVRREKLSHLFCLFWYYFSSPYIGLST